MKILITKAVYGKDLGGAETEIVDTVKVLKKLGNQVRLVTNSPELLEAVDTPDSLVVFPTDRPRALVGLTMPILAFRILRVVRKINPDVVLCESRDDLIATRLTKRLHKKPFIFRDHSDIRRPSVFEPDRRLFNKLYDRLFFSSLEKSSKILTVSTKDKEYILSTLKSFTRVEVMHSGIIIPTIGEKVTAKASGPLQVSVLSRLVPGKGLIKIAQTAKKLDRKKIQITFVGDGPLRSKLEPSYPEITFAGHMSDVAEVYKKSDIVLTNSHYEGFGRTVVEALAYGCTVVASNLETHQEQLADGTYGFLFPVDDTKSMIDILHRINEDRSILEKYSATGPERASKIASIDIIVSEQLIPALEVTY